MLRETNRSLINLNGVWSSIETILKHSSRAGYKEYYLLNFMLFPLCCRGSFGQQSCRYERRNPSIL